jgi:hypothetical protein
MKLSFIASAVAALFFCTSAFGAPLSRAEQAKRAYKQRIYNEMGEKEGRNYLKRQQNAAKVRLCMAGYKQYCPHW